MTRDARATPGRRALLEGYQPLKGVPDELIGEDGRPRAAWGDLIAALSAMTPEELAGRHAAADRYLSDAGVFYRQYEQESSTTRDWPMSHMPVLIDRAEWEEIAAALTERADLLEKVMADLYGPGRLVAGGHLPPALVAGNPEWLRPMVGVQPRSGHYLHYVAFDIGRGPGGAWWVLGDRCQAPSGAGFALENRIATARAYSEHYARANVERLAGFFRRFRDALMEMGGAAEGRPEGRVAIMTPGPANAAYFEHAYIARYLGVPLLEGDDMVVRGGQLMVRTVSGLRPISVLWRRLDATWADPLELDERSHIGTPGLVSALRAGGLSMVNALGSGVLETRALLAFLPRISELIDGRPLRMPNIATWWCGGAEERAYVRSHAGRMTVSSALSTRALFDAGETAAETARSEGNFEDWLERQGGALVGQEAVSLSTTPAFEGGRLVPRPMSLRIFLARTKDGWQVMPGGYARIGRESRPAELALQRGGLAADVWVVSKQPVQAETMLPASGDDPLRLQPSALPSRAADNLFWLGRYIERAEMIVRLWRAWHVRLAEQGAADGPLFAALEAHLAARGVSLSAGLDDAVGPVLQSAIGSAAHVRDRFSLDGWLALTDLERTLSEVSAAEPGDGTVRAASTLLRMIAAFSGLVHENMYRFSGWRFLSIGRDLERAHSVARLLADFADPEAPDGALDLAIELGDSTMSHRRRYAAAPTRATVLDLLALDALNPRAVAFQLTEVAEHVSYLPGAERHRQLSPFQRALLHAQAAVQGTTPGALTTERLNASAEEVAQLSTLLAEAYFR
ncbi:circularly permuted type 2 ATP-grasp protein [Pseudoroseicyclus tamaricis]|uniref:Circularly permuted type 2 ATP-grasp protein n=1 Tax=Pseudoroseicyclus tamaricis TaxID=2705421 RepID=A0A6B2JHH6_9RHOB|nr:circularly permuted type 2 ATP-grasp protein [Pseudoroseicyclus tamaricis]NDV00703.1 circularly permuted type 2 ATP-grasp protein [Pseudoroseicyclus tamaricis]